MRQSIQPNWQKALKKDDFFKVFLTTMNANSTKKMEKCGLFEKLPQAMSDNSQKASIHTGQKCGPIQKIPMGRRDGGAMELSAICSTCMSTVRHTGQEMWTYLTLVQSISIYSTGFDKKIRKMCTFLKDPYE